MFLVEVACRFFGFVSVPTVFYKTFYLDGPEGQAVGPYTFRRSYLGI